MSETGSGGPKLSEVARHVILPEGIVSTGFPPVEARATEMGVKFDSWQTGLGLAILAKRESGLYAAGIGGVVISIPRQVGKTFTVGAIIFALCSITPNLTVIWTAHRVRTHNETFRSMASMADRKQIKPHVKSVRRANGEQEIEFNNGSRILFGARESGFGNWKTIVLTEWTKRCPYRARSFVSSASRSRSMGDAWRYHYRRPIRSKWHAYVRSKHWTNSASTKRRMSVIGILA